MTPSRGHAAVKRPLRVVLDTNIMVSVLLFSGHAAGLVEQWRHGRLVLLFSRDTLAELVRVMNYPKFKLTARECKSILHREVLPFIISVNPRPKPKIIKDDPDDDMFLACALAGKADYLVSGDTHLLELKTYRSLPILSLRTFIERLANT